MIRAHTWLVHGANLLVGGTGLVYGWMRYALEPEDPFSVVNHPWQPDAQHLHVLFAPLLVFAGGLIWSSHVAHHWRAGSLRGRRTGVTLAALLAPMIFSGYALQISVQDEWRTIWMWLHVATSLLWLLLAVVHPSLRTRTRD